MLWVIIHQILLSNKLSMRHFFKKKRFLIKPWKVKKAIGKKKLEKKNELLALGLEKN